MNITQLRYFHAVATYRSVSGAAQHLYISQPSLSNAIKELEKEFSTSLFYRRYNGMFLTPEGTRLYTATKELLERFDEVEHLMQGMERAGTRLRLGIPPMIGSFVLRDIYKSFLPQNGEIDLSITEKGRYELFDQLNDGILDLLLLPHTKPFDASFSAKRIGSLEIACFVGTDSPLAARETVDAAALSDVPLVLFSDTFFQTRRIKAWFSAAKVEPRVLLQTEQLSTAERMIEESLAAGFMFKCLAKEGGAMRAIPLSPAIRVDVSVIRKRDTRVSDAMRRLEDYLEGCISFEKPPARA